MPTEILPIIYPSDGARLGGVDNESSLHNCIPVLRHNNVYAAQPREEITSVISSANSDSRGRGVVAWAGQIDLYLDEDTYYYDGGSQDLTATTGQGYTENSGFNEEITASFIQFNQAGVDNLVIVNAGHASTSASAKHGNIWYQSTPSGAVSSVSDTSVPWNSGDSTAISLVRGGASLDGYLFVGTLNGNIYNCDLDDISSWSAVSFIAAEREADTPIYIGKQKDHVVYIGTRSIEFFYNASKTNGSPLQRRPDIYHSVGCLYPNSVVELGDIIYFVGTDSGGKSHVYKLENFSLTIVSDTKIDEELQDRMVGNWPDITTLDSINHAVWLSYIPAMGTEGLILTNDFFFSYYYHMPSKLWCQWNYDDSVTNKGGMTLSNWLNSFPITSTNGLTAGGTTSRYQFCNGEVGYFAGGTGNDAMNDLGAANTPECWMLFPKWDAGTNQRKRINSVRVLHENWNTTITTSQDPTNVDIRWHDYDAVPSSSSYSVPSGGYSTGRTVNLNEGSAATYRCGITRQRQFALEFLTGHGAITAIIGLEIDYDILRG